MTLKELNAQYRAIMSQRFKPTQFDPISYAIERSEFEERQLRRLISLGEKVNLSTARSKVACWNRQIKRLQEKRIRLNETKTLASHLPATTNNNALSAFVSESAQPNGLK